MKKEKFFLMAIAFFAVFFVFAGEAKAEFQCSLNAITYDNLDSCNLGCVSAPSNCTLSTMNVTGEVRPNYNASLHFIGNGKKIDIYGSGGGAYTGSITLNGCNSVSGEVWTYSDTIAIRLRANAAGNKILISNADATTPYGSLTLEGCTVSGDVVTNSDKDYLRPSTIFKGNGIDRMRILQAERSCPSGAGICWMDGSFGGAGKCSLNNGLACTVTEVALGTIIFTPAPACPLPGGSACDSSNQCSVKGTCSAVYTCEGCSSIYKYAWKNPYQSSTLDCNNPIGAITYSQRCSCTTGTDTTTYPDFVAACELPVCTPDGTYSCVKNPTDIANCACGQNGTATCFNSCNQAVSLSSCGASCQPITCPPCSNSGDSNWIEVAP